jgi:hypothetical protein
VGAKEEAMPWSFRAAWEVRVAVAETPHTPPQAEVLVAAMRWSSRVEWAETEEAAETPHTPHQAGVLEAAMRW